MQPIIRRFPYACVRVLDTQVDVRRTDIQEQYCRETRLDLENERTNGAVAINIHQPSRLVN